MDKLIVALGPAFATGFAVQQFLELLDRLLLDRFVTKRIGTIDKKLVLGITSLIIGFAFTFGVGLRVLQPLGIANADFWDVIVTALVISAGTDGFNTIVKFLGYAKDEKKGQTTEKKTRGAETPARREQEVDILDGVVPQTAGVS